LYTNVLEKYPTFIFRVEVFKFRKRVTRYHPLHNLYFCLLRAKLKLKIYKTIRGGSNGRDIISHMGEMRNAYRRKPKGKRPLERPRRK
jgi:hypothetical protein